MRDITRNVFDLFAEILKRGKWDDYFDGKYHPSEDPTFPQDLLKTP